MLVHSIACCDCYWWLCLSLSFSKHFQKVYSSGKKRFIYFSKYMHPHRPRCNFLRTQALHRQQCWMAMKNMLWRKFLNISTYSLTCQDDVTVCVPKSVHPFRSQVSLLNGSPSHSKPTEHTLSSIERTRYGNHDSSQMQDSLSCEESRSFLGLALSAASDWGFRRRSGPFPCQSGCRFFDHL